MGRLIFSTNLYTAYEVQVYSLGPSYENYDSDFAYSDTRRRNVKFLRNHAAEYCSSDALRYGCALRFLEPALRSLGDQQLGLRDASDFCTKGRPTCMVHVTGTPRFPARRREIRETIPFHPDGAGPQIQRGRVTARPS